MFECSNYIYSDETSIKCPNCGCTELHQRKIFVFCREEDAEQYTRIEVDNITGETRASIAKKGNNPSVRRQGLSIEFDCEGCSVKSILTIAQHKGVTLIDWKDI